jgi:hypothetical protein
MRRAVLLLLLLAAAPAARAGEGVYITIDGGYSVWNKDTFKSNLAKQVGTANASLLVDNQMPDGGIFGLHLGYNMGGHVAIETGIQLHPWSILGNDRGAVGAVGVATRWFPLQGLVKPGRQVDFSLLAGVNYFLHGGNGIACSADPTKCPANAAGTDMQPNTGRGFDGMAFEFGGTFELYPAKWVSLGLTPRIYNLKPLRYFTDFNHRDAGGQQALQANVGGALLGLTLSVTFHFEPQPD